ncbi:hypothetical protein BU24DRAFT_419686 [Aaosphaeria arxii CBS 175.79]|uniref:Uncharacterized protein n=1 Tax=Aaosphaeria arxii CBS 175.79 TaxID=1450172 RepID=A0A6A5Y5I9_9PLEO|nr:uncharacterized protein BU24DRAFT_419686 [Aaosphaeria arxii CBS 175.79]KAF2020111.1 hypothetical protein BU24DRAFT_419686 [Aaosphaeria arxii CBS 175.79]
MSTTTTAYTPSGSYLEIDTPGTEFDWNGWGHGETSPFQQGCRNTLSTDEIPPDRCAQDARIPKLQSPSRKPSHLSVQCKIEPPCQQSFPLAPPNTAYTPFCHSTLSPVAANFEPRVMHEPSNLREASVTPPQLDKLSISGFLGSKSVQKMRRRRFSDAAIGHLFDSLLHVRPRSVGDRHHSWCPGSEAEQNNDDEGGPKDDALDRARTV